MNKDRYTYGFVVILSVLIARQLVELFHIQNISSYIAIVFFSAIIFHILDKITKFIPHMNLKLIGGLKSIFFILTVSLIAVIDIASNDMSKNVMYFTMFVVFLTISFIYLTKFIEDNVSTREMKK